MSRMVTLAQKYRPAVFKDVLDQDAIVLVLKNILKNQNFSSPFMFTGLYGGGKTTLARIFARAILCESLTSDLEPCNRCQSCLSFLNEGNLSYTEIDAASNSGVDKIRKLREDANFKSLGNSMRKVVVIDECHSITQQGNEALLKQLEDSTERQVYIFCTTAPEKMLDTVRSRCFEFSLNNILKESISTRLEEICGTEKIPYEKEALDLIANQSAPHVRDSLKELDFLSNFGRVTKKVVFEHFKLDVKTDYLKVIFDLKGNLIGSLQRVQNLSLENNVTSIYEGLIEATLNCQKLTIGLNSFQNEDQLKLAKQINDKYKEVLPHLLEELLKRNRYSDSLVLESDLILISGKIKTNFVSANISSYQIEIADTKQDVKQLEVPVLTPISEVKDHNPSEPLEQTSQILKRYKAYPESLAILMDKGKKSSSIKNTETVELKQRVKDYKRNLDKDEIKDFLETKRIII